MLRLVSFLLTLSAAIHLVHADGSSTSHATHHQVSSPRILMIFQSPRLLLPTSHCSMLHQNPSTISQVPTTTMDLPWCTPQSQWQRPCLHTNQSLSHHQLSINPRQSSHTRRIRNHPHLTCRLSRCQLTTALPLIPNPSPPRFMNQKRRSQNLTAMSMEFTTITLGFITLPVRLLMVQVEKMCYH